MEFFTLNPFWNPFENPSTLYAKDGLLIDEYESAIWTERFSTAGDVTIVLKASEERIAQLAPGTLLGLQDLSHNIMLLDTRVIKDGLLTVTGKTVEAFFNNRFVDANDSYNGYSPQEVIWRTVKQMQKRYQDRAATYFVTPAIPQFTTQGTANLHQGVHYGEADYSEDDEIVWPHETISFGPAYEQLERIAKKHFVGMGVFWRYSSDIPNAYTLEFETWSGDDKTRDQPYFEPVTDELELVQFSPALDNFVNVEDVLSEAEHKNVVVALPPPGLSVSVELVEVSNIPVEEQRDRPFSTRVMEIVCDDITEDMLGTGDQAAKIEELYRLLNERAKRELRKDEYKKIRVIDGEFTPTANDMYRYTSQGGERGEFPGDYADSAPPGVIRYRLGDLVEVQGHYGGVEKVRVTEYIRSKDASGVKSYPTLVKDVKSAETTTYTPTVG